jgi:hypothetical protein
MRRLAFVALAAVFLGGCETVTEPEVQEVPTVNDPFCIAPPSGIVSWWPGEGSASDVVGPNDASLGNGSTFAPGKVGQAFSLDAEDDVVEASADNVGALQELTVEVWVRLDALRATEQRIVTLGDEKAVLRRLGDNLDFFMRIDGELTFLMVSGALQAGVFHHVVGTYNGRAMKLFVDGVRVAARSVEGTVQTTGFLHFSGGPGAPLGGLLDEITVYDRPLLGTEIQAIFDAGSAGKCKP